MRLRRWLERLFYRSPSGAELQRRLDALVQKARDETVAKERRVKGT